jgi:hypothetical protein
MRFTGTKAGPATGEHSEQQRNQEAKGTCIAECSEPHRARQTLTPCQRVS